MLVISSGFFSAALVIVFISTAFAVLSNALTIHAPFKGTKRVKQKTASYILMSFFRARFLSAFEKIARVFALLLTRFS